MTFEEDFPSITTNDWHTDDWGDKVIYLNVVKKHCIDKQKIANALTSKKIEEYLNGLHTQPNDPKFSPEYRRGWIAAGSELAHYIKQELNLE